jgi:predicted ATPase
MASHSLVARENQIAELTGYLDRAVAGDGEICFVSGEAGSGKTALVMAFAEEAQDRYPELIVALGNCNSQSGIVDPYLPFREILALLTGDEEAIAKRVVTPENAGRIKKLLSKSVRVLVEVAPELIGTFVPGGLLVGALGKAIAEKAGWTKRLETSGEGERGLETHTTAAQSRVFEQFTRFLNALAADHPILVILDDLQWADAASSALLFHLSRRIVDSRVLIVGTFRPEEVSLERRGDAHPLESVLHECKRYHGDVFVALDEVGREARLELVDAMVDLRPNLLGPAFRQTLFEQTSGHPLFTIELLRDLHEAGHLIEDSEGRLVESPGMDWEAVPARVEGVIEKRVGRLDSELREMLAVASVEGEEFTAQIVAQVRQIPERQALATLSRELGSRHRLVRELGNETVSGRLVSHYRFTHALFQHYLYEQLGSGERRLLHGEIASALEDLYTGQTQRVAVQLARHFEEAENAAKAANYHLEAGQGAIKMSAPEEAITHFRPGLELSRSLSEPAARAKLELPLRIGLGNALIPINGYSAPEVEETFARARELCGQLGEAAELWPVLWGQFYYFLVRGEHGKAHDLGGQLLARLSQHRDKAALIVAHHTLGVSAYFLGRFDQALEHLDRATDLYDRDLHHPLTLRYGRADAGAASLTVLALALFSAGYPDQAMEKRRAAVDLARELSHPWSLATVLGFRAVLDQTRGDAESARESAGEAMAVSTEYAFPFWQAAAGVVHGWALSKLGEVEEGLREIEAGLSGYRGTGADASVPQFLGVLADSHRGAGRLDEALEVVEEALAMARRTGERHYEAELYRSRGRLRLATGGQEKAEADFRQALAVARRQGAKMFELRAATALARLWRARGEDDAGRRMLEEILGRFTEGLDTPSLEEARALLS